MGLTPEQAQLVTIVYCISGSLAIFGCCIIILCYFAFYEVRRSRRNQIIFYLCISDLVVGLSAACLIWSVRVETAENYIGPACYSQSIGLNWGIISSALWSLFLTLHVLRSMQNLKPLPMTGLFLFVYLIPMIPTVIYIVYDMVGPSPLWCWLKDEYDDIGLLTFYGIWAIVVVLNTIAIVRITRLHSRAKKFALIAKKRAKFVQESRRATLLRNSIGVPISSRPLDVMPSFASTYHASSIVAGTPPNSKKLSKSADASSSSKKGFVSSLKESLLLSDGNEESAAFDEEANDRNNNLDENFDDNNNTNTNVRRGLGGISGSFDDLGMVDSGQISGFSSSGSNPHRQQEHHDFDSNARSLLFPLCFILQLVPALVHRIIMAINGTDVFTLFVLHAFFAHLGGFIDFLIFGLAVQLRAPSTVVSCMREPIARRHFRRFLQRFYMDEALAFWCEVESVLALFRAAKAENKRQKYSATNFLSQFATSVHGSLNVPKNRNNSAVEHPLQEDKNRQPRARGETIMQPRFAAPAHVGSAATATPASSAPFYPQQQLGPIQLTPKQQIEFLVLGETNGYKSVRDRAMFIIKTYCQQGAECEVNVSGDAKEQVLSRWTSFSTSIQSMLSASHSHLHQDQKEMEHIASINTTALESMLGDVLESLVVVQKEVEQLLAGDAWHRYQRSEECMDMLNELRSRSEISSRSSLSVLWEKIRTGDISIKAPSSSSSGSARGSNSSNNRSKSRSNSFS